MTIRRPTTKAFDRLSSMQFLTSKQYVANRLNSRSDRVNTYGDGTPDRVTSWTFEALKHLKQQLESTLSNQSQYSQLRLFFELIPEFNRNMKAVSDALSTVVLVQDNRRHYQQQNLVVEWAADWKNNELESVSIKTKGGEAVTFLNKIVIRRDLMQPPRYEMLFS
jgi:hypothetical protein